MTINSPLVSSDLKIIKKEENNFLTDKIIEITLILPEQFFIYFRSMHICLMKFKYETSLTFNQKTYK